jgi:hypothetical protein
MLQHIRLLSAIFLSVVLRFSLFTWRSIFRVLCGLLFSNLGQVPDVEAAVGAGRSQDSLVMGRPLDLLTE